MVIPEGAGEVVARAQRHDAEQALGLGRETGEAPDGAVAATGEHALTAGKRRPRRVEPVGGRFRHVDVAGARRKRVAQAGEVLSAATTTSTGIHDGRPAHGARW